MPENDIPNSPTVGSPPPPAAVIDPAGSGAPLAPAVQQAATSVSAPLQGAPAPVTAPPAMKADDAFAAFMAEATAKPPEIREPTPAPAAVQPPAEPVAPAPDPTQPPAELSEENLDQALAPTQEEQSKGLVPAKNLHRALASRRKAIDQAKDLQTQLGQESQLVDRVLQTFQSAGVDAQTLPSFLANLGKARSDTQAQAAILAQLGIQAPAAPKPAFDPAAIIQMLEAYDVDKAISLLRGGSPQAVPPAPVAPPAQQAAPPAPVQPQPQAQQPIADNGEQQLKTQVFAMGQTLLATYGKPEATRLYQLIDKATDARLTELRSLGLAITPQAVAKIYLESQGKVLQAEKQIRSTPTLPIPPPVIRPGATTQPKPRTADEQFDAEFGRR